MPSADTLDLPQRQSKPTTQPRTHGLQKPQCRVPYSSMEPRSDQTDSSTCSVAQTHTATIVTHTTTPSTPTIRQRTHGTLTRRIYQPPAENYPQQHQAIIIECT